MDYELLTKKLKERTETDFTLSYSDLETIIGGPMPEYITKHYGFTKKSRFGKAILEAGFLFENRYKKELVIFQKNEREAKKELANIDVDKTVKKKNIFINIVFPHSAEYVNLSGNLGHEIIDLFGADNGEYHYYLNPWGMVDENNVPDVVISICQSSVGLYKILNKAIVKKVDDYAAAKNRSNEDLLSKQKRKFKYNGIYLENYFEDNPGGSSVLSSFECSGIYEPVKPIYFVFNSFKQKKNKSSFYKIVSTSPGRAPKFVNFNQEDQDMLEELVDNEKLWNKEPIKSFRDYVEDYKRRNNFNYFKEIGVENQELQYSNALRFFLEHYKLTNQFLKKIGCSIDKKDSFVIDREHYNIDLFFTNFNNRAKPTKSSIKNEKIVIIENKIKANVTPSDNDKTINEQIEKIYRYVYETQDNQLSERDVNTINQVKNILGSFDEEDNVTSQLSKYYIYAVFLAKKRGWSNKKISEDISCYFLCPEYSRVMYGTSRDGHLIDNTFIGQDKNLFLQEKYKLITYKDIVPVFENCLKVTNSNKHRYFLEDFVDSLKTQAKDRDDSLEQEMIELFYLRSQSR